MDTTQLMPYALLAAGVAALAGAGSSAYRTDAVRRYARRLGLTPTPDGAAELGRRVGARERSTGAVLLLVGAVLVALRTTGSLDGGPDGPVALLTPLVVAAPLGMAVAALRESVRRTPSGPRVARTTAPRVHDYVPGVELVAGRALGLATPVLVVASIPVAAATGAARATGLPTTSLALAAGALVLLLATELVARRLVARPTPSGSADDLVWADASTAFTLRHLYAGPAVLGAWSLLVLLTWSGWTSPAAWVGLVGGGVLVTGTVTGIAVAAWAAQPWSTQHVLRRLWSASSPGQGTMSA